jgi:tRNA pseudouridine38-40 synthase
VKTYDCDVKNAVWKLNGNLLTFHITADRFLRNMVRAIVGTLIEVGEEKLSIEDFKRIIESKDRTNAGPSAPAKGLFLTEVQYPKSIFLNE